MEKENQEKIQSKKKLKNRKYTGKRKKMKEMLLRNVRKGNGKENQKRMISYRNE